MERTQTTRDDFFAFIARAENQDKRFELIDGEIIEVSPVGYPHGKIVIRLGRYMDEHAEKHQLGEVVTEVGAYQKDDDTNVLAPDIAFYRAERFSNPDAAGFLPFLPDWAIEVVSPSDLNNRKARIDNKIARYKRLRVPLLWYIYPNLQHVVVYRPEQAPQTFTREATLDASDVMPGFTIPVAKIFTR